MFEFRLNLYRRPDGSLMLRFSWAQRAIFLVIFGLLLFGMVASTEFSILGLILSLAAILGALFEDSWTWDVPSRTLTHRLGLLGLNRQRHWPATDITGIELRFFVRGQNLVRDNSVVGETAPPNASPAQATTRKKPFFATAMIGLAFDSASQGMVTIETHRQHKSDGLEAAAAALAATLQVPLNRLEQ